MPPLVSVLTPVFNGERYLRECIESVLAQTYTSWEYVIVDNCSTDGSGRIAREYAERDPRIRVITNDHHVGVIQNHNIAFRQTSPEAKYCKVVQADDRLFPRCLEEMVAVAEAHPSVAIVSSYVLHGRRVEMDGLPWPSTIVPGRDICRWSLLGNGYVFGSPTSLLIRADFVRRRPAFFDESTIHADEEVCYEILREADFGFVHQVLTFTRIHDEDLTMSSYSRRLNTYLAGNIRVLQRYGSLYLDPDEYADRFAARLDKYYLYLANNLFGRDAAFWSYHLRALEGLGLPLNRWKLAVTALTGTLKTVSCPDKLVHRLMTIWRRRITRKARVPMPVFDTTEMSASERN